MAGVCIVVIKPWTFAAGVAALSRIGHPSLSSIFCSLRSVCFSYMPCRVSLQYRRFLRDFRADTNRTHEFDYFHNGFWSLVCGTLIGLSIILRLAYGPLMHISMSFSLIVAHRGE